MNSLSLKIFAPAFAVLMLLASVSEPQGIFILQNPYYSPESVNSIDFYGSAGRCAGNYGIMLNTLNGFNWTGAPAFTHSGFRKIFFVNQFTGYLIADSNRLYRTTDGGSNWIAVYDFSGRLQDVIFKDANAGFAVTGNRFGRTVNGGLNWSFSYPVSNGDYNLYGVYFLNSLTGFISAKEPVTTYACLLSTTDGGNNWSVFNTYIDEFEASKLFFLNQSTGWFAGSRFEKIFIMKTLDAGLNWNESIIPFEYGVPVGLNYSVVTGGFVTTVNRIYRTTDNGNVWTAFRTGNGLTSSFLKDDSLLFVSDSFGRIFRINVFTNRADTVHGKTNEVLTRVQALSQGVVVATGYDYAVRKTSDGGQNWLADDVTGHQEFSVMVFTDGMTGYGISGRGHVKKTTNFGSNWFMVYDTLTELTSVSFTNQSTGWVFGGGFILKTTNGGINWTKSVTQLSLYKPLFFNAMTGYALGDNILYRTSDGGNSWTQKGSELITEYFFIDENTGWNTSSFDTVTYVFRTTNGGLNWSGVSHVNESTSNVKFLNSSTGYIAGRRKLYRTTNSGFTWKSSAYPVSENIRIFGMDIIDDNNGWVCGDNSAIIKIVNGGMIYVQENETPAGDFRLYDNYPNPFNGSSRIIFEIAKSCRVSIVVYDVLGKEVSTLVNEKLNPGKYETVFDGSLLASGVYFYRITAGDFVRTMKMVLIK